MSGAMLLRRAAMSISFDPLDGINVGDPFMGGYFAGVKDTTQAGAIPSNDAFQTGYRAALIDLGKSKEAPSTLQYKTANSAGPTGVRTVHEGLGATQAMIAAGSAYPAAQYAAGVSVPDDGASPAYIPSMWEMLMLYWAFKNTTDSNYLTTTSSDFPSGTIQQGYCPISDPQHPAFTAGVPARTSLAAWQSGGAQAFDTAYYWTSTESSATYAWLVFWTTTNPGRLGDSSKNHLSRVRLVRQLIL